MVSEQNTDTIFTPIPPSAAGIELTGSGMEERGGRR